MTKQKAFVFSFIISFFVWMIPFLLSDDPVYLRSVIGAAAVVMSMFNGWATTVLASILFLPKVIKLSSKFPFLPSESVKGVVFGALFAFLWSVSFSDIPLGFKKEIRYSEISKMEVEKVFSPKEKERVTVHVQTIDGDKFTLNLENSPSFKQLSEAPTSCRVKRTFIVKFFKDVPAKTEIVCTKTLRQPAPPHSLP